MALNWLCLGLLALLRPWLRFQGWLLCSGLLWPECRRRSPGTRPTDHPVSSVVGTSGWPSLLRRRTAAAPSCGACRQALLAPAPSTSISRIRHRACRCLCTLTSCTSSSSILPVQISRGSRTGAHPVADTPRLLPPEPALSEANGSWSAIARRPRRSRRGVGIGPLHRDADGGNRADLRPLARNCCPISGGTRPRRSAFRATRRFPAVVLGPVDFRALRRLAASRAGLKAPLKGRFEIPSSLAISYNMTYSISLSMCFFEWPSTCS